MHKYIVSVVTAALIGVLMSNPAVHAQNSTGEVVTKGSSTTAVSNIVYLATVKPTVINNNTPSNSDLENSWVSGPCTLSGQSFKRSVSFDGVGVSFTGPSWSVVFLPGHNFDFFEATVGIDDHYPQGKSKVSFHVLGDGQHLAGTEDVKVGDKPIHLRVPIKNVARLELRIGCENVYAFKLGDVWWGDARLVKGDSPTPEPKPSEPTPGGGGVKKQVPEPEPSGTTFTFDIRDIDDLAKKLKMQVDEDKDQFKTKPVEVAVASFDLIPKTLSPDNARKVREQLSIALTKTKTFKVIERGQLDKILDELRRSKKDITDEKTAQQFGKQVNARNVLVGSISDEKTTIIVNVRMINTETGESTIAESVEVKKR